jgi:hypothetical protein
MELAHLHLKQIKSGRFGWISASCLTAAFTSCTFFTSLTPPNWNGTLTVQSDCRFTRPQSKPPPSLPTFSLGRAPRRKLRYQSLGIAPCRNIIGHRNLHNSQHTRHGNKPAPMTNLLPTILRSLWSTAKFRMHRAGSLPRISRSSC